MALSKSVVLLYMLAEDQVSQDMLAYILVDLLIGNVMSPVVMIFFRNIEVWSKDKDPKVAKLGKQQEQALKVWLMLKYPLVMNEEFATISGGAG